MENTFCNGDCSRCPVGGTNTKKPIKTAVASLRRGLVRRKINYGDYCIEFVPVPELSSILDIKPDVLLYLVDSTDLSGTMYPVTKCIDMEVKAAMVLENYDGLLRTNHRIDTGLLSSLLGMPVAPADYITPESAVKIASMVAGVYENPNSRKIKVPYGTDIERAITRISGKIGNAYGVSPRYMSLRLLEHQDYILPYIYALPNSDEVLQQARHCHDTLEREFGEESEELVRKGRLGFINGALQETLIHSSDNTDHSRAQKIDAILTNRWLGIPIMVLVLLLVFEATFALGACPEKWIQGAVGLLGIWLGGILPQGWFSSMLVDGIIQGVGAVLTFLPNIVILFFFLSLLEDSGYMARCAFAMDKIMHRIGLHGRSFIPMLIGFGCNVPAIMAARSIEDKKDRTLTMLMIPFMSCSARLPVYMLFASAFFPSHKALVMISIYLVGIILSILFAFVMKRTKYFRKAQDDYVSELPSFRKPTWRNTGLHIWERVSDYLRKISTVILAASVIIWALEYFPSDRTQCGSDKEQSYLADIGRAITPLTAPLGFDWKMNVCILTGLPAKEAIVSTMGILYHADEEDGSLAEAMRESGLFTPAISIAFMLFVLLYFPCIATVATLKREAGRGWALFSVFHSLIIAWTVAFLAKNLLWWL